MPITFVSDQGVVDAISKGARKDTIIVSVLRGTPHQVSEPKPKWKMIARELIPGTIPAPALSHTHLGSMGA